MHIHVYIYISNTDTGTYTYTYTHTHTHTHTYTYTYTQMYVQTSRLLNRLRRGFEDPRITYQTVADPEGYKGHHNQTRFWGLGFRGLGV